MLLVAVPLLMAFVAYGRARPDMSAPPSFRAIHPAPPTSIPFRDETIELTGLENPLRSVGSLEEHYEVGKRVYYENCIACHGDGLAGRGHYAQGFNPAPLNFQDVGTIAQLTRELRLLAHREGRARPPQRRSAVGTRRCPRGRPS